MKSMRTPASLLCFWTFAVLAVLASQAKADLIVDGDFATPTVGAGGFDAYHNGDMFGGPGNNAWTATGPNVAVAVLSGTYSEPGITFNSQGSSANNADLTGNNTVTGTGLSQTIATTASTAYTLTFWLGVADSQPTSNNYSAAAILSLQIAGGTPTSYTNSSLTQGSVNWVQETVPFTATSSSTTLSFLTGEGNPNVNYIGLDNVSVNPTVAPAVPEPNTLVLGGIGTLLVCWAKFRRHRKTATA